MQVSYGDPIETPLTLTIVKGLFCSLNLIEICYDNVKNKLPTNLFANSRIFLIGLGFLVIPDFPAELQLENFVLKLSLKVKEFLHSQDTFALLAKEVVV